MALAPLVVFFRVSWRVALKPQLNSTTDSVLILCYRLSIHRTMAISLWDRIAVDCCHIICLNGCSSSCGFFRVLWRLPLEPQLNSTTDSVLILCYQLSIHRTMAISLWTKLLWIVMLYKCLNGCSSSCGFFCVLWRVSFGSAIEFYYRFCTHTLLPVEYS